jgi:hypothetical protein
VHQVAQAIVPDARVVYVDNDPIVLTHGRALLVTNDGTTVITADLREPDSILERPELLEVIDPSEPVAVLMIAILHSVPDKTEACRPAGIQRSGSAATTSISTRMSARSEPTVVRTG